LPPIRQTPNTTGKVAGSPDTDQYHMEVAIPPLVKTRGFPCGDFMRLTKQEILQKLEENGTQIKEFHVKRIGLFGSYIRNEQQRTSDVDILVEFEDGMKTFDRYMELNFFLEELLDCKVDLVLYEALKPRIKPHIMREVEYA